MNNIINSLFELNETQLKQVEEFIQELLNPKKKRGLSANNYCWVIIQKIADKIGTTKEEVYKDFIKNKGIFRIITINNEAVNTFIHSWSKNGLGFICETSPNKISGLTDIIAYYGTSSYNTKQMSNFIDYVVQEAKQLDIETLTPNEIQALKDNWR